MSSIAYEEKLLAMMVTKRRIVINKLAMENDTLPSRLEDYLTAILGNKDHAKKEEVELHTKSFMERNEYVLIDPLHIDKRIEEWEERILQL